MLSADFQSSERKRGDRLGNPLKIGVDQE